MSQTSPNRRKSIAIPDHSARPSTRRRAQSMVPEILSPASRARLSRGPRKSILKMFPMKDTDDPDSIESSQNDSADARKALNRRVSFAETQVVRFFHKDKDRRRRSSRFGVESPQSDEHSSPAESAAPPQVNNENQYPGVVRGRRSSIRQSLGEISMEIEMDETQAIGLSTYVSKPPRLSDILNDDDEDYAEEDTSMELDDVMPSRSARRRSSSAPPGTRLPLSEVVIPDPDEHDLNRSTSFSDATSDYTGSDYSRSMEIVVPMGHVFNAPEENPAWLALRAATHSGNQPLTRATSDEDGEGEEDMELTHAVSRLQTARDSIGRFVQDDSFSSEDSSFADNPDRTTNLTDILRRESLGAEDFTMNTDQGSTMELTRPYLATHTPEASSDAPEPPESTPPPESEPQTAPSKENDPPPPSRQTVFSAPFKPQSSVFLSPTYTTLSSTSAPKPPQTEGTAPFQFTFTPKPVRLPPSVSPKKSSMPQRPSAAFAPPVTRPSPKKRSAPDDPPDGHSPSKKRSLPTTSLSKGSSSAPEPDGSQTTSSISSRRLSLRRPSGYLAQRKSIGGAAPPSISGPRKLAGRASMAQPGTGDAWSRFDPQQPLPGNIFRPNEGLPSEDLESTKIAGHGTLEESTRIRSAPTELFVYQDPEPSTMEVTSSQETEVIPEDEDVLTYTDDLPPEDEILPDAGEQHENSVEEPSISIQQFLEMTGIRFMDEIIVPRRSSIHHGQTRRPRRSSLSQDETPSAPLADYCIAMNVNAPQLELYTHVAHDLEAWIARSKTHYSQAEEEALRMTPELFREYATADEEGRAELLHQLKLIKAHAQATAKGEWYDWKLQWVEQLYESADKGFKDLEKDATALQGLLEQSQTVLPPLREEYAQIMRELEEEQSFIASIEQDDQDYLNELKTSISEQGAEVQALRTELSDSQQKIEMLEIRISEWEVEKRENEGVITESQRIIDHTKNSTISEVARKQAELQRLQSINGWSLTRITPDTFEFILADRFRVSVPCADFKPNAKRVEFSKCSNALAVRDLLPDFDLAVLRTAPHQLKQGNGNLTTMTQISQRIRDFWSSCSLIRRQLEMVNCKFCITISELPGGGFTATFPMLYYDVKSKVMISFIFDRETMANWPLSIGSLQCKADVVYGTIDPQKVLQALQKRLREATPADSHACLWDACIEALECLS